MKLTMDEMKNYLENVGYAVDGMKADEIAELADAEYFTWDYEKKAFVEIQ